MLVNNSQVTVVDIVFQKLVLVCFSCLLSIQGIYCHIGSITLFSSVSFHSLTHVNCSLLDITLFVPKLTHTYPYADGMDSEDMRISCNGGRGKALNIFMICQSLPV